MADKKSNRDVKVTFAAAEGEHDPVALIYGIAGILKALDEIGLRRQMSQEEINKIGGLHQGGRVLAEQLTNRLS